MGDDQPGWSAATCQTSTPWRCRQINTATVTATNSSTARRTVHLPCGSAGKPATVGL